MKEKYRTDLEPSEEPHRMLVGGTGIIGGIDAPGLRVCLPTASAYAACAFCATLGVICRARAIVGPSGGFLAVCPVE